MKSLYLTGVGVWSPGFADARAWRAGEADPELVKPPCKLVSSRLKRGSSRFAQMLGEALQQASVEAGFDVSTVSTVYGSSLGEITTMAILLKMIFEEEGKLSPNRFKNAVHNAASGLLSIATENTAFSTAIAAGDRTFEASFLEGWALLAQNPGPLVLAVADDVPPEPLAVPDDYGALALAFALTTEKPAGPAVRLENLRRAAAGEGPAVSSDCPTSWAAVRSNPTAAGLPLLQAYLERRSGSVPLGSAAEPTYWIDVALEP